MTDKLSTIDHARADMNQRPDVRPLVGCIYGTRPEAIKMAPILRELACRSDRLRTSNIVTSQHTDLLDPLLSLFDVTPDHRLGVLRDGQSLDRLLSRLLKSLDTVLSKDVPSVILVQGDTTSALAGALAAHHRKIPLVHVEAGWRSGDRYNPFPEEMNRRLVTQLANFHMAATTRNVEALLSEHIEASRIFLTGNPVVDAIDQVQKTSSLSGPVAKLIASLEDRKLIVLTSHRRESFGVVMRKNLEVLRDFVEAHEDVELVFPVHPNPSVRDACDEVLSSCPRIRLVEPMIYPDFIALLGHAWLIVSDSGGIQEEAPSLGKPLLVLRENTERPEVIECGCARLIGSDPGELERQLRAAHRGDPWIGSLSSMKNPFGDGSAAKAIVDAVEQIVSQPDQS